MMKFDVLLLTTVLISAHLTTSISYSSPGLRSSISTPPEKLFNQENSNQELQLRLKRNFGYSSGTGSIQGSFTLTASAPMELSRVVFYIDGQVMAEIAQPPYQVRFNTGEYSLGEHLLEAIGTTNALIPNSLLISAHPLFHDEPFQLSIDFGIGAIQQARLQADDPHQLDEFGWSVAIFGDTAVIGARNADPDLGNGPLTNAGSAYVFHYDGQTWVEDARLIANDATPGDSFGVSVAIWGDTIAVGATGHDHHGASDAGAVYIFRHTTDNWKQVARLIAADSASDDNFGNALALSKDTLVVGADGKDLLALPDVGAAYVFINRGGSWDQKAKLLPDDPVPGGFFGTSAGISGNHIAIGATQANPFGLAGDGAVYIYQGSGRNWQQTARLSLDNGRRGDFFGNALAIDGNTLVAGAVFRDIDLGGQRVINSGAAYVYQRTETGWELQAELYPPDTEEFERFGESVSVSESVLAIGAGNKSQAGLSAAGTVYLFTRQGKSWSEPVKIVADTVTSGDRFGSAVSISGERLVVGAAGRDPLNIQQAGEAFAYKIQPVQLPDTGFPPQQVTPLRRQPADKAYAALNDLWLEIPGLGIKATIVGVPRGGDGWDTSWLWDRIGYLEGTSFPTLPGNTALAAHAYLPSGTPGPYYQIDRLKFGDTIILHAWGQKYVYEVRRVLKVQPSDLSILDHQDLDWITLITCDDYDARSSRFTKRLVAQAVLVRIE